MNTYVVGQELKLKATFKDEAGVVEDPTTVTFKVIDPLGVETVYSTPTRESKGAYHQVITLTTKVGGVWTYRSEGTGNLVGAGEGQFKTQGDPFA